MGFLFLEEIHPNHTQIRGIGRSLASQMRKAIDRVRVSKRTQGYVAVQRDNDTGQTTFLEGPHEQDDGLEFEVLEPFAKAMSEPELATPSTTLEKPYTIQVILQILSVSLLAFHKVASDTLIPIFLASPSFDGGREAILRRCLSLGGEFGMSTTSIGYVLLSQAVIAIIAQLLVVPAIIERFGALYTYRWTLFMFPWMYCLTPFVMKLPRSLSVIALLLDLWIKVLIVALGYVCSAIL